MTTSRTITLFQFMLENMKREQRLLSDPANDRVNPFFHPSIPPQLYGQFLDTQTQYIRILEDLLTHLMKVEVTP